MKKTMLCEAVQDLTLMSLDGSTMRIGDQREFPIEFARPLIESGFLKEVDYGKRPTNAPDSDPAGSGTDLDGA